MPSDEGREIAWRLRAAEDHLQDIIVLVEADAPCRKVLSQLFALRAELQSLKIKILNCQVNASKNIIQNNPCADHRFAELRRLVNLFCVRQEFDGFDFKE